MYLSIYLSTCIYLSVICPSNIISIYSFVFPRLAFPDSVSIEHFSVCASLGELEHKQRRKKESTIGIVGGANRCGVTIGLIDSTHQVNIL